MVVGHRLKGACEREEAVFGVREAPQQGADRTGDPDRGGLEPDGECDQGQADHVEGEGGGLEDHVAAGEEVVQDAP